MAKTECKLESTRPLVSEAHGLKTLTLTSNTEYRKGPPEQNEAHACHNPAGHTDAGRGQFTEDVNCAQV